MRRTVHRDISEGPGEISVQTEVYTDQPIYTEEQIDAAKQLLRRCVEDWCERLQQTPEIMIPVVERLTCQSDQVTVHVHSTGWSRKV